MRDFKPCDNVFPNEFFLHPHPEVCQWLSFNPLGKVIHAYQQILLIPYCFGEKAHDVQSPLSKGPRAGQWVKNSPKLSTSLHTFVLLSAYLATSSLVWMPCGTRIYPWCGFHKFLHAIPPGATPLLQGVHIANMGRKRIFYTTFGPQTTRTEVLSSVYYQLHTYPQAGHLL